MRESTQALVANLQTSGTHATIADGMCAQSAWAMAHAGTARLALGGEAVVEIKLRITVVTVTGNMAGGHRPKG